MKLKQKIAIGLCSATLVLGGALGAQAQTATSPVDDLITETDKLDGIYDTVLPVAVGAMAFAMGAGILKRVAYA